MFEKFLRNAVSKLFWGFFRHVLSDKQYAKVRYWLETGRTLHLKNPKLFTEKIQYIKLFEHSDIRKKFANRYAVREFVTQKIGRSHLIPLIGNYNKMTPDIWETLPNQFVLKANHGSEMIEIIRDKQSTNYEQIRSVTHKWKNTSYYKFGREWAYKEVPRTIVAEELILDSENSIPKDFKFFCFDGVVEIIQIDFDRFEKHRQNLFDRNFNPIDGTLLSPPYSGPVAKPELLDEAVNIAEVLAEGINFIRVDLYLLKNKVYFGELTNYPLNGFVPFKPMSLEQKFGSLIKLQKSQ
ncbi:MAG TPA: ATP-grasp fold amidoligase family protein [Balneolaceae bacterium]|nr:ATP-grasp fold amidoligase family protein [Balneolaceae bacterium]